MESAWSSLRTAQDAGAAILPRVQVDRGFSPPGEGLLRRLIRQLGMSGRKGAFALAMSDLV